MPMVASATISAEPYDWTNSCSNEPFLKNRPGLEAPLPLDRFRLNAVAPKAAMMDVGLARLFDMLGKTQPRAPRRHARSPSKTSLVV
jgi:hypothetical protein